ncbi:MAG: HEAT repeat domain-containing protein [Burkholderiales bacterium]
MIVSLFMLATIVALRIGLVLRRRREQQFIARWQPLFAQCMDRVPEQLPALAIADHYAFLKLFNNYHELLRGSATRNVNLLAVAAGMDVVARGMLSHVNIRRRLIAVTTLGHLGDKTEWNELQLLVAHPSPLLSLAAMRALLEIDAAASLTWLITLLGARVDWPLAKVAPILEEIGPDLVTAPLVAAAEAAIENAPLQVPRLLRLLEVAHSERAVPAVRRILQSTSDEEVIVAGLRLLRDPLDIEMVRNFSTHPSWIVRVGAARALARIGEPEDRKLLTNMVGDPNRWVRYRAARTLLELPFVRISELQKIRAVLPDRFAAEMLGQVIAEHRLK